MPRTQYNSPQFMRVVFVVSALVYQVSCTHPIDIEGRGALISTSGDRNCAWDEATCDFSIADAYIENYTAEPAAGFTFIGWEGCYDFPGIIDANGNECGFNVPTSAVRQNWFKRMPPLRAHFVEGAPVGPSWSGEQQYGTPKDDWATVGGIIRNLDGSLIFGGSVGTDDCPSCDDAVIYKTDAAGEVLWRIQFGSTAIENARNILADPSSTDFFVIQTIVSTERQVEVHRFDTDGNRLWMATAQTGDLGRLGSAGYWSDIDANGDIVLLSWRHQESTSSYDSVITKISGADGSTAWSNSLVASETNSNNAFMDNTDRIRARGVSFDANDNIVVVGNFEVENFGSTDTPRTCGDCPFLASFDGNGNLLWKQEPNLFDGFCSANAQSNDGRLYRLTVGENDALYVVGHTLSAANGVTAKYNADGSELLWSYCDETGLSQSWIRSAPLVLSNGDVLTFGEVNHPRGDDNPLDIASDLILVRHSMAGNRIWRRSISRQEQDGSQGTMLGGSAVETPLGFIYISAFGNANLLNGVSNGGDDVMLLRLGMDGRPL